MSKKNMAVACMVSVSVLLSGCVANQPGGGFLASHSADPNDVCGVQRAELLNSKGYFERSIMEGAMTGALVGALAGLAIGAAGGGKNMGQAVAIGAVGGMVAGGIGGYFQAQQQQNQDMGQLSNAVYGDISKEAAEVQRATVAFQRIVDCRQAAATRIKSDFKAGLLTKAVAEQKLAEQKAKFAEELAEAERIGAKMTERRAEMNFASEKLLESDPSAKQAWEAQVAARKLEEQKEAERQAALARKKAAEQKKKAAQKKKMAEPEPMPVVAAAPSADPWPVVQPQGQAKPTEVAAMNDNLNKRSGDYDAALAQGKQLAASGFDLAG